MLLLGPLYHLTSRFERVRALREAFRVLRRGGVVVAAAISRFASTYDGLFSGHLEEPEFEAIVERDVEEGQHRNPSGRPEWFTTAYFHLPDELRAECHRAGFVVEALVASKDRDGRCQASQLARRTARRERLMATVRE